MWKFFQFISVAHAQVVAPVTQVDSTVELSDIILRVSNWTFTIGGGLAVIYVIYGGFIYLTAGGDENKTTEARSSITSAIIGFVIIALSFTIVNWLAVALDFARPGRF